MKRQFAHRIPWTLVAVAAVFLAGSACWIWWVKSERKRTERILNTTHIRGYVADNVPLKQAFENLVPMIRESDPRLRNFSIHWSPLLDSEIQAGLLWTAEDPRLNPVFLDLRDKNETYTASEICGYLCKLASLRFQVNRNELAIGPYHTNLRNDPLETAWDSLCFQLQVSWEELAEDSIP